MKAFWTDLTTGWANNLRRHSVQLNACNIIWSGSALLALQFGFLPEWFMVPAFTVALVLLISSTLASNLKQKAIATYNPLTERIVPIGEPDGN